MSTAKEIRVVVKEMLGTFLANTKGRFLYLEYIKKDGQVRCITCKFSSFGAGRNKGYHLPYITVWEVGYPGQEVQSKDQYRGVDLRTIYKVHHQGQKWITSTERV